MVCLIFKGCLPQILLGLFLNTLSHFIIQTMRFSDFLFIFLALFSQWYFLLSGISCGDCDQKLLARKLIAREYGNQQEKLVCMIF